MVTCIPVPLKEVLSGVVPDDVITWSPLSGHKLALTL